MNGKSDREGILVLAAGMEFCKNRRNLYIFISEKMPILAAGTGPV